MMRITRRDAMRGLLFAASAVKAGGQQGESFRWPSEVPPDCPIPKSPAFNGLFFTGKRARYQNADTWYPSWAADGNLYSPWTDGKVNGLASDSSGVKNPEAATTGQAVILGNSPLDLRVENESVFKGDPRPYGGRYPCGSLVYSGVWFYGTYCLADTDGNPGAGLNWDIQGPFVGFRTSRDFGKTWTETPHTPAKPIFGEPERAGAAVKIGAPHFVDFGRNMQHSPDGKAYLVAHGATAADKHPRPANHSWITGDEVYLLRVEPAIERMNDPSAYEFYAGGDRRGRPRWTRDLAKARPLVAWNNHMGCVTATYNPELKKFLMCVTDGGNTVSRFNTYILEADQITGPWRMACFLRDFGEQAYFVNIPSKFIGAGGRSFWLLYSANFTNGYLKTNFAEKPPGSGYGMCWQEVRFAD